MIDGRHRYAACAEAGVQPRFHHLADDDDPLRYVLAKNALKAAFDREPARRCGPPAFCRVGARPASTTG